MSLYLELETFPYSKPVGDDQLDALLAKFRQLVLDGEEPYVCLEYNRDEK